MRLMPKKYSVNSFSASSRTSKMANNSGMNALDELDTSILPPSFAFELENFLRHRRTESLQLQNQRRLLPSEISGKSWVKETLASLQHYYFQSNQEVDYDLLSQSRGSVQISIPFQLSLDSFPVLSDVAEEIGDEQNQLLLRCSCQTTDSLLKLQWGPNHCQNDSTMYVPYGYEELEKKDDKMSSQKDERSIYLIQLFPEETSIDTSITLDDIESIAFSKETYMQNFEETSLDLATSWLRDSLSVKVIPTSRFIEIVLGCTDEFQHLMDTIDNETSLDLRCSLEKNGVIIIIIQNLDFQAEHFADLAIRHSIFGKDTKQLHAALLAKLVRLDINTHSILRKGDSAQVIDPFSSRLSFCTFTMGKRIFLQQPRIGGKGNDKEEIILAKEFLKLAVMNSTRFIPQRKRMQWDEIPNALLFTAPYRYLPLNLSIWLSEPSRIRSDFDSSMANSVFYLIEPMKVWMKKVNILFGQKFLHQYYSEVLAMQHYLLKRVRTTQSLNESALKNFGYNNIQRFCEYVDCDIKVADSPNRQRPAEIISCYLQTITSLIDIECVRCMDDMKQHDLYSIRWECVEIPPPIIPFENCFMCSKHAPGLSLRPCPYHLAFTYLAETEGKSATLGKSIPIKSKEQLEQLPLLLQGMRPWDNLAFKIVVHGLAENWPLVCVGDLVRLRFEDKGLQVEVVGEVADVVVKTEILTILIPPPVFDASAADIFPYINAVLHTKTHFIDYKDHWGAQPMNESHSHLGRFDIRFGFLGGLGFKIAKNVIKPFIDGCLRGSTKSIQHVGRIVAPTISLVTAGMNDKKVIPTHSSNRSSNQITDWIHPLNLEQRQAVVDIVFRPRTNKAPYLIVGPAGTGKSLLIVESIIQILLVRPNAKILVCAPSDAACDVLARRIYPRLNQLFLYSRRKHNMLRINWWARKVASLPAELLPFASVDSFGFFSVPSPKELLAASVVICQCFLAGCLRDESFFAKDAVNFTNNWKHKHFTDVFVDEVSQAMEFEVLVPLLSVGLDCSIVLAGDPKQLGPTVRSPLAYRLGLGVSLQDRLLRLPLYKQSRTFGVMTKLTGNYRSHEALLRVPSELFYDGALKCLAPVEVASPFSHWGTLGTATDFPLLVYDVRGTERNKVDTPSFYNIEECNSVVQLIGGLMKSEKINAMGGIRTDEIAVIAPFRAQVLALRVKLRRAGFGSINVGVVEDFQGQECKVVLISTVLTKVHSRWSHMNQAVPEGSEGEKFALGFMHDPKRFNVAITRAQALVIIVGNTNFLEESHSYWTVLIEHVRLSNGLVNSKSANEGEEQNDCSAIKKLIERVEELKLLGSGFEEDKHDLALYYDENPQWKVMLT